MKFGPVPVAEAHGSILAHSVAIAGGRLRKGMVLGQAEIAQLVEASIAEITVAALEPGDIAENDAAQALAEGLRGANGVRLSDAFTGRVNAVATHSGVARVDADKIARFNLVNPMITIATVPDLEQVDAEKTLATIKVISFAVAADAVAEAAAILKGALSVSPPQLKTARLIVTEITGGAGDKGVAAIEARLNRLGVSLAEVVAVPHDTGKISAALGSGPADLTLILTGSATSDIHDVAPEAVRLAGGLVERFGMPVDPGNLLFLGDLDGVPVVGLPGCARSPALNGTDWVLSRVICGIPVTAADIAAMGVGGLLKDIPTRPQPRRRRN